MRKIAKFIVEKKALFFALFIAAVVYSVICIPKVNINYDIASYLPEDTDTRQALTIMEKEFTTYGTTKVMIRNVTFDTAKSLVDRLLEIDGVKSLPFENTPDYYKQSCALLNITFYGDADDSRSVKAYQSVIQKLEGYDYLASVSLVDDYADKLANDMTLILILAAAVIVLVILFTSQSYMEVLVFPLVFGVAALLNMGTNYWLGQISFVSNSVSTVLQLALAIDYSIILCHRFTEEKEKSPGDGKGALIDALSKAIPEIAGSSLTTIAGLIALTFMNFRLGFDLGMVLAKSIIFSILTVFLLMPGILMLFSKLMDKTRHRSFVPKISFVGKGVVKARYALPVIFLCLCVVCGGLQSKIDYVYSLNSIDTNRPTETKIAAEETERIFGKDNMFVILMPKGDYELERKVLKLVEGKEQINSALGISNVEIKDGYYLTDNINYKDFAGLTDVKSDTAKLLYTAYGLKNENYIVLNKDRIDEYKVPILDIMDYLFELKDSGAVSLDPETDEILSELEEQLKDAKKQLIGENYTRLVFNIDGDVESDETFALIDELLTKVKALCPGAIFAGDSMSSYDLNKSFVSDNLLINILTILFVMVILGFTFRSYGLPILLVLVIQGAIFINFTWPVALGENLFFFVSLIISAIQMGATIDYAIVITNRFNALKKETDKKTAAVNALNQSFPTILTSGSIMIVAAFLIGFISSDPLISSIGMYLGRGVIISVLSVMLVLPALLIVGDKLIEKTRFAKSGLLPAVSGKAHAPKPIRGFVNGRVRGNLNGYIDGEVKGRIIGEGDISFTQKTGSDAAESADTAEKEDAQNKEREENLLADIPAGPKLNLSAPQHENENVNGKLAIENKKRQKTKKNKGVGAKKEEPANSEKVGENE